MCLDTKLEVFYRMSVMNDSTRVTSIKSLLDDDGDVVDYSQKAEASYDARKYLNSRVITIEVLATLAVVVLLFSLYQSVFTNVDAARDQQRDIGSLRESWSVSQGVDAVTSLGDATVGDAIGILQAKSMSTEEYPVYKGVFDASVLNAGPAIYDNASDPGELGNMSIAAHRDGWNAPFSEADKLGVCDEITFETESHVYLYKVASAASNPALRYEQNNGCFGREIADILDSEKYKDVSGSHLVSPDDVSVTWPVPGAHDVSVEPDLSFITFTTCHPHWSSEQRLIIHGVLTDVLEKVW